MKLDYGPNDAECGVYQGDCRALLRELPADSVQCVVTSPPYWGLRDYGVGGQIGLESSPDGYVAAMVDVFREVRRVLRPDGVMFLNIGDSYNGSGGAGGDYSEGGLKAGQPRYPGRKVGSLKPKDLCGIPWRVALALQADGWWLRSDIIWAKGLSFCDSYAGSSMPESVTDRPSKSHEYVFLLTKQARYFYDAEAVREDVGRPMVCNTTFRNGGVYTNNRSFDNSGDTSKESHGNQVMLSGRNLRSVWAINPAGFAEAHFATFPPALVEPMIKAGTSEHGACSICGAPWKRVVEKPDMSQRPTRSDTAKTSTTEIHISNGWGGHPKSAGQAYQEWRNANPNVTTGWQPTCDHDAPVVPCVALDPFGGAGTTGLVAFRLGRRFLCFELNPAYVDMARRRIVQDAPLLVGVA